MADGAVRVWPALDLVFRSEAAHPGPLPESGASERPEGEHWAPAMPDLRELRDDHLEGFLTAFLYDYSPTAMVDTSSAQPDGRRAWRVFFSTPDERDVARAALAASEWHERVDVDAIEVGNMIVAPPWDLPEGDAAAAADKILIVIEPSMGFGTGHHQTTRLCLRALQELGVSGKRVLDLGTGSGVLAIAAAKLGAAAVLGVDDDPDAVDAARKNVTLNGLAAPLVRIERADIKTSEAETTDVVLANLTGALLVRFAEGVMRHATPGGLLILSGFTEDERFSVGHAFRELEMVRDDREDGWIGLTLRRP